MKSYNNYFFDSFILEKKYNDGYSELTLKNYYLIFNILINNIYIEIDNFKTYTVHNLKKLLQEEFVKNNWSASTYNTRRKCFSCYCNFLVKENHLESNPFSLIPKMKEEKKVLTCYTEKEVSIINFTINSLFDLNTFLGLRNYTILKVLLYTGLRRSELLNLKASNVILDNKHPYLIIYRSKGNKTRLVPISDQIIDLIKDYYKYLINYKESEFFFCSFNGKQLTNKNLYSIIKKIESKLNFHITLHKFRHTFATELVKNNFNLFSLSQILGHSDIKTTRIYLNSDVSNLQSQISGLTLYS